jgi:1-deoxy-D-xylulose-5-phosphate synthase
VLKDNEWSIAKNVGAIASYLNSIVTNPTYAHLHDKARDFIQFHIDPLLPCKVML